MEDEEKSLWLWRVYSAHPQPPGQKWKCLRTTGEEDEAEKPHPSLDLYETKQGHLHLEDMTTWTRRRGFVSVSEEMICGCRGFISLISSLQPEAKMLPHKIFPHQAKASVEDDAEQPHPSLELYEAAEAHLQPQKTWKMNLEFDLVCDFPCEYEIWFENTFLEKDEGGEEEDEAFRVRVLRIYLWSYKLCP